MCNEIRHAASSQNPRATPASHPLQIMQQHGIPPEHRHIRCKTRTTTTSADSLQIYATAQRSPRTTASADPSQNSTAQRHSPYTKPMAACTYASDGGLSITKSARNVDSPPPCETCAVQQTPLSGGALSYRTRAKSALSARTQRPVNISF